MRIFNLRITGDLGFEFWQDIPNYEGRYQVSTHGRVRSLIGNVKILKPRRCGAGRFQYLLYSKDKEATPFLIHRLVATTFIPNPQNFPQINHIDEDPKNNNVGNLEWCTPMYNNNFGTRNYRISQKKNDKIVLQFNTDNRLIKEYQSLKEVCDSNMKFNRTYINMCCNGSRNTAYGYIWRYKESPTE